MLYQYYNTFEDKDTVRITTGVVRPEMSQGRAGVVIREPEAPTDTPSMGEAELCSGKYHALE